MSEGTGKSVPELCDYGDTPEMFVDELVCIHEAGAITTLVFARLWKAANGRQFTTERRVMGRLLLPTHMVKRIGHLLVAGPAAVAEAVPMPEEAPLH
jgi:hypothetical protein